MAFSDENMTVIVPDIKGPILIPSAYSLISFVRKIYGKTKSANNTFGAWLISYITPEPKRIVNEKLEALQTKDKTIFNKLKENKFQIRESNSSIKEFAK